MRPRRSSRTARLWRAVVLGGLALTVGGCAAAREPLRPIERRVDLERFMGSWYVLAHVPIDLPFFSEANAYNGVESYRLTERGVIETTYRFRAGGFDGALVELTPRAWVHDERTNSEWRMQFVWPFRAAYLIVWLDEDYQTTIIGVPGRSSAWIMARTPDIGEPALAALEARLVDLGYDTTRLRRVPQRWPAETGGSQ